jgi:hypothetical protein
VPLHLEEEIPGAEDVPIRGGGFDRLAVLLVRQTLGDLALETTPPPGTEPPATGAPPAG